MQSQITPRIIAKSLTKPCDHPTDPVFTLDGGEGDEVVAKDFADGFAIRVRVKESMAWMAKRVDQIELHSLPSYSPDLNPDEYLNCDLKGELSRKPGVRQKGKFQDEAKSFMRKLAKSPARVKSYFSAKPIQYAADAA